MLTGVIAEVTEAILANVNGAEWGNCALRMVLVPGVKALKNISTDSKNGGPWIMWPDTPYAHLRLPIDSYPSQ